MRLSPFRTVVSRAGTRRRSVTALTATASVGETIAPRAKRHRERQARDEPVRHEADGERRERDQPDREEEDRPLGLRELAQRHQPAVGEEERRQEAEEEEAGIQREPRESRQERRADAARQVGDELRPGKPAADDAQARDHEEQQERVLEGDQGLDRACGPA